MKLNIPFISQNDSSIPEEWHGKSCGIACLKMCLDFYKKEIPAINELINEGEIIGARIEGIGWKHDGLVRIAHNHGVPTYQEEFRSVKVDLTNETFSNSEFENNLTMIGLQRIKDSLAKSIPVIVSFKKGFGSVESNHDLVIIGYEEGGGFIVHDPSGSSPKEAVFVDEPTFVSFWRKFAIFVG